MRAAGLLSVPISRVPRDYLVFFRREVAKTVTWAGEPVKTEEVGPNGVRLTPRKSFEAWSETVRHQCERWSERDIRAAEALRLTLVELILRTTETADVERDNAAQRNEILIAELNHRVRNILGLVRGLITQSMGHATDTASFVEGLGARIHSMARAYDILSGRNWSAGSLHELLTGAIGPYRSVRRQDDVFRPGCHAATKSVFRDGAGRARTDHQRQKIWRAVE